MIDINKLEEISTKVGDLNAILADIVRDTGNVEVAEAYKLCNSIYTDLIKYDQNK